MSEKTDYIPRAHDAGRDRGRVGEFFDNKKVQRPRPRSERLQVASYWLHVFRYQVYWMDPNESEWIKPIGIPKCTTEMTEITLFTLKKILAALDRDTPLR
jgi:hypothetical protein